MFVRQSWEIEDTGQLDRFLGIKFRRSDDKEKWAASATTYLDRIVKRFDLNDTVVVKVPMDPGFTLTAEDFEKVSSEEMKSEYRSFSCIEGDQISKVYSRYGHHLVSTI